MLRKDYTQPVLFVGAGVSYPSGLPLAADVKRLFLSELCKSEPALLEIHQQRWPAWEAALADVMLESVLEIYARHCPGRERELARIFLGGRPTHYHRALAELLAGGQVRAVITTNFDDLIERAYSSIRRARPGLPGLTVVRKPGDAYSDSEPRLIKIHGCARYPATMALTLSQVGKGLPLWLRQQLETLSENPFIFLGYSDRDKDISPVLFTLTNTWAWILHHSLSPEEHIPRGSLLEAMVSRRNRFVLHTDANLAFIQYAATLTQSAFGLDKRVELDEWQGAVSQITRDVGAGLTQLMVGDMVYELLGDWEAAEAAYVGADSLPSDARAELLLKRTRVYGDRWRLDDMESLLNSFERTVGPTTTHPARIRAMLAHAWGSCFQKRAIRVSEQAEGAYTEEEQLWKQSGETGPAALARLNKAVVLQKRGRYKAAEPLYRSAIDDLRAEGLLAALAKALVNYGSLLGMTARNDEALRTYEQASALFLMLGEPLWTARLKVNIGIVLSELGRSSDAEPLLREAREVLAKFEDTYWLRNADMALKDVLELAGDEASRCADMSPAGRP